MSFIHTVRSRRRCILRGMLGVVAMLGPILPPSAQDAPPPKADLTAARELVRSEKYAEAEAAMAALQQQFPDDAALLLLRGEALVAAGKPAEAIPVLRHAAEVAPAKVRVHFQLGSALAATGDTVGALDAFAKEIELNADPKLQVLAHLNRSILLQKAAKPLEAAAELEAVLALEPDRSEAYGDLAELYLEAGKLDEAGAAADRGAAAGFVSSRLRYRLGVAHYNRKAYEAAVAAFEMAIAIQPDLAQAQLAAAKALDHLQRTADADAHLKTYLDLRPDAPEAEAIRKRLKLPAK